jgi:hypothetical protein
MTRVAIATFEHILQYLACARAMVKFEDGRGVLANELVCLSHVLSISLLLLTALYSEVNGVA